MTDKMDDRKPVFLIMSSIVSAMEDLAMSLHFRTRTIVAKATRVEKTAQDLWAAGYRLQ